MAITSRDLRSAEVVRRTRPTTVITLPQTRQRYASRSVGFGVHNKFAYAICIILALFLANAMFSPIVSWFKVKYDDVKYGRPRTMQTTAFVGHDEANGLPSHFVAMNMERRIVIVEMPGGDPAKARTIVGPYLFGAGEDLTPVSLRFADVNADQRLDMLVSVKQEEMVYINDAGSNQFRMITSEELAKLQN